MKADFLKEILIQRAKKLVSLAKSLKRRILKSKMNFTKESTYRSERNKRLVF